VSEYDEAEFKELIRRLEALEKAHDRRLIELETHRAIEAIHRAAVEDRLANMEGYLAWILRTVLGSIIAVIVMFALNGGFVVVG
jgi:hypothetical protein